MLSSNLFVRQVTPSDDGSYRVKHGQQLRLLVCGQCIFGNKRHDLAADPSPCQDQGHSGDLETKQTVHARQPKMTQRMAVPGQQACFHLPDIPCAVSAFFENTTVLQHRPPSSQARSRAGDRTTIVNTESMPPSDQSPHDVVDVKHNVEGKVAVPKVSPPNCTALVVVLGVISLRQTKPSRLLQRVL